MDVQCAHDLILHLRIKDRIENSLIHGQREGVPPAVLDDVRHVLGQAVREKIDVLAAWLGVLGEKIADCELDFVLLKEPTHEPSKRPRLMAATE